MIFRTVLPPHRQRGFFLQSEQTQRPSLGKSVRSRRTRSPREEVSVRSLPSALGRGGGKMEALWMKQTDRWIDSPRLAAFAEPAEICTSQGPSTREVGTGHHPWPRGVSLFKLCWELERQLGIAWCSSAHSAHPQRRECVTTCCCRGRLRSVQGYITITLSSTPCYVCKLTTELGCPAESRTVGPQHPSPEATGMWVWPLCCIARPHLKRKDKTKGACIPFSASRVKHS